MKISRFVLILSVLAIVISTPSDRSAQDIGRAGPVRAMPPIPGRGGFIPPAMETSHLRTTRLQLPAPALQLPASWDWRALGGVTSVKDQGIYSSCWAFAALGDLESKVLIDFAQTRDYSEFNLLSCAPNQFYDQYGYSCLVGGNAYIATNYLSRKGATFESCGEYPGTCPAITCFDYNCDFERQAIEWRIIVGDLAEPGDVPLIKEAVMNHGPVYTAMYSQWSEFWDYDTDTCLTYSGTEEPDHAVLIVGWADSLCDWQGGWIVKNSWGTSWGDNGYFYIKYGDARIGSYTSVISDFEYVDWREKIYWYDDYGFMNCYGWEDSDDWGLVRITPDWSGDLDAVDFWAASSPTTYTIYVYEDFNGSVLTNPTAGPVSGTVTESGYYSVDLPSPPPVAMGDPFYIAIRFQTPGHGYPIPFDYKIPYESNKSWVSDNSSYWYALDNGGLGYGDVGIRGRVVPHCAFPIPPLEIQVIGVERVPLGMNDAHRYYIEVVNRSSVPDVLFEDAPDLWPYTPENSRCWVDILDASDHRLLGEMSELDSSDDLDSLYFDNWTAIPPPDSIYIGLKDKRCLVMYGSEVIPLSPLPCGQPGMSIVGFEEVSFEDSLWAVQVEIENLGPGDAYEVIGILHSDAPWLGIVDPDCAYGRIDEGSGSLGTGSYLLDMHGYPGGPFDVWIDMGYEDICYNAYGSGEGLVLDRDLTGDVVPDVTAFALVQNYPNPFNPYTVIKYEIPEPCRVRLAIFDVSGRLVRTLVDGHRGEGRYTEYWYGRDERGRSVASGIYFYRLEAGSYSKTKRMVLLR